MSDPLTSVREQLAAILAAEEVPAVRGDDGNFSVPTGATTTHLDLSLTDGEGSDGATVPMIDVWAAVADDVPRTPDVFRFAAEFTGMFGQMVVRPSGEGRGRLVFTQSLLADPISSDVIMPILSIVATTANESGFVL